MGPGYPLLFEFMKRVGYLLFILTITFFVPVAYMILEIYSKTDKTSIVDLGVCGNDTVQGARAQDRKNPSIFAKIGIISTGAFVKEGMEPQNSKKYTFEWFNG